LFEKKNADELQRLVDNEVGETAATGNILFRQEVDRSRLPVDILAAAV